MAKNRPPITPNTYKTALMANTLFEFVSAHTIFPYTVLAPDSGYYLQKVFYNNEEIWTNLYIITLPGIPNEGEDIGFTTVLKNGIYTIYYEYGSCNRGIGGWVYNAISRATYNISVVENHLPLKKWTITDVINRTLDIAEPIRQGEKPRFKLNAEQAAQFDKIISPEFSFTKQTLRECLQEVGRFIHGEPRLTPKKDEDGNYYYEVTYDMYASQEKSGIYTLPYLKKTANQVIDAYASYLDSSAENLVNQLDKYQGVIVEPYHDGAKTVRTESVYARISDSNMLIATQYPIYSVEKLEYVYADGDEVKSVDITPYLFEQSIYEAQLSSYAEQYPYSKAYGLFYAQGSKNIGGLNFKVDAAIFPAFKEYAIINILQQAIDKDYKPPASSSEGVNYYNMAFRVTYTPFYNARVGQTKAYYKDFKRPAALIYNQQANVIESRYYGENLKGAIARLGNAEKTLTFHLTNLVTIPQAGQMYDDDYYISAVTVEYLPTIIKCTISLSKDFNRISAYIGISSAKRYSEISQTQAVERNVLYREYIVIGDREEADMDCLLGENALDAIAYVFSGLGSFRALSNVCAWGTSKGGKDLNVVYLPVISSAFGNSISFSWKYEDNYSAGAISQYQTNGSGGVSVSGYFQNNYQYADYYGRLYYYNFYVEGAGPKPNAGNLEEIGRDLPKGKVLPSQSQYAYISTVNKLPYLMRKDNREALQVNYQVDFVTNKENIIIGSALASYCPLVRGVASRDEQYKASLYTFDTELNKFTDHVEAYENVDLSKMPSADVTVTMHPGEGYFEVNAEAFPETETGATSGKSWAIITRQREVSEQVEDEDGNPVTQTTFYGGDLLIGQNINVTAGQAFTPIYFTKKREIFDKSVWKDRK